MAGALTWYDILDVLPGSSADEVQRAFEKKAGVLRPELIAGTSPKVLAAAGRARTALEAGRHILTDPASRNRYDAEIGIRRTGGGLSGPASVPSRDPWAWDYRDGMETAAMDAIGDWLAPHAAPPRRIAVPDVRGLFIGPCRRLLGDRDLNVEVVRLTRNPMPVEGLVVDQSPLPGGRVRRASTMTVQVWHPSR